MNTENDPARAIAELASRGVIRHYARQVVLIQEGDTGDSIFIVMSGRIKAFVANDNGREFVLGTYGPNDYVGEMSLDGGPRSASVITLEPTVCSLVSRAVLIDYIRDNPAFAFDLIRRIIRRTRAVTESAGGLALLDVYGRIVRLLTSEAVVNPATGTMTVERLSQQAIADRVGCSREMVSRIIKDLTTGGYLVVDKSGFTLLRTLPSAW